MTRLSAIDVVYATWCPHSVPTTVEPMKRVAAELGIPCRLYNIDGEAGGTADEMVRRYGDWSDDYTIPQVFFEFDDGSVRHMLTGDRRGVRYTKQAIEDLLGSDSIKSLRTVKSTG